MHEFCKEYVVSLQTVTLMRPAAESPQQRLTNSSSFVAPAAISTNNSVASFSLPTNRTNQTTNKALSATVSKAVTVGIKIQTPAQSTAGVPPENSQDKLTEQVSRVLPAILKVFCEQILYTYSKVNIIVCMS